MEDVGLVVRACSCVCVRVYVCAKNVCACVRACECASACVRVGLGV